MKRFNWLLIGFIILCLAMVLLAGCVSKSEYEALQAEHATVVQEKASLTEENTSLKAELEAAQSDLTNLQAEYDTLEANYDAVKADYDAVKADYEAVNTELDEIKGVYPPRDFSSRRDLEDWLLLNDVSEKPVTTTASAWYGRALEVQEDALADGYVVSVDYDGPDEEGGFMIFCITVIDGDIWYWDPETDEVTHDPNLGKVK